MIGENNFEYSLIENLKNLKGNLYNKLNKVTIFGCNDVGICCAVALMCSKLTLEICLIDPYDKDKANIERLDLEHSAPPGITLSSSSDIEDSAGSDICIMCIDKAATEGRFLVREDFQLFILPSSIAIIKYNAIEYKKIIPIITKRNPNTIIIVAVYPNTFMTYTTWKSSKLPINRIIGIGTSIETIQFRNSIAKEFNVSSLSINGYILGSMKYNIPVYSEANIAGTALVDINDDAVGFHNFVNKLIESRKKRYNEKGLPNFSIGTIVCKLVKSILTDSRELYTVATKNHGYFGLERNLFLALPALIGRNGVHTIIIPNLNKNEIESIQQASVEIYNRLYKKIIK